MGIKSKERRQRIKLIRDFIDLYLILQKRKEWIFYDLVKRAREKIYGVKRAS